MPYVSLHSSGGAGTMGRPIVQTLFVASLLLSIVSYYTTQQGMALYLSPWFSVLAALGIQVSLVMVAWLVGFTRKSRALLIVVYVLTALVSIAFSYVSLHTWFAARERPAQMRRALFDELSGIASRADQLFATAHANGQRYVLALEELTAAEKTHGSISRARDADPYLNRIREAVAREAETYASRYREGSGEGVRYTAFDRYTKIARQSVSEVESARQGIATLRASMNPEMPSGEQLRRFQAVYDTLPWSNATELLGAGAIERPAVPDYSKYADRTSGGQEDLMVAFTELVSAPTSRHLFAFGLAAFIDVIVFLLAFASGPYFFGSAEQRWCAAAATLDAADSQVFARSLLRKLEPAPDGLPRVDDATLSPGERQLCMLLVNKGLAASRDVDGRRFYVIDPAFQESLLETLVTRGMPLRAAGNAAAGAASP